MKIANREKNITKGLLKIILLSKNHEKKSKNVKQIKKQVSKEIKQIKTI